MAIGSLAGDAAAKVVRAASQDAAKLADRAAADGSKMAGDRFVSSTAAAADKGPYSGLWGSLKAMLELPLIPIENFLHGHGFSDY